MAQSFSKVKLEVDFIFIHVKITNSNVSLQLKGSLIKENQLKSGKISEGGTRWKYRTFIFQS